MTSIPNLQQFVNTSGQAFLTVDASCQLHHANQTAKEELKTSRCLALHGSRIYAAFEPDQATLIQAVERAVRGLRSILRLQVIPTANERGTQHAEIMLLVTPLQGDSDLVALQLERRQLCDPSLLYLISRSYRLTAAEERVLALLCDGQDVAEIAKTLEVATSTIRSHVVALRNKTSVSSIRQLIQRIALLPPLMGAISPNSDPAPL